MKRYLPSLLVTLFLVNTQIKSQVTHTIQYQVNPASCATCCDGSFTLNITNCWNYVIQSTPTLSLLSYTGVTKSYTNVCSGTYTIYASGSDACGPPITDYFTMPFGTGLTNFTNEHTVISVFPNPAKDFVHFKQDVLSSEKGITLVINDLAGSMVKQIQLASSDELVDVSDFEEGIYFVNVLVEGELVETKKLFVVK